MFEIGATLREARVRRRLTLHQVEEDTKIRVKYLQAMENEEFDVLPAPAYVKGFLRSYATYLGLDADVILEEYLSRHMPRQENHPFGGSSALRPQQHHSRRRSGLAFLALLAVLILALIYLLNPPPKENASPIVNPSLLSPSASVSTSPSPSPSPSRSPVTHRTVVRIRATQQCYIDVRKGSATGTPLFQSVLAAGATKTFTITGALYLTIGGDPAHLTLTVNGKAIRTQGAPSGVSYLIAKGKVTRQ